MDRIQDTVFQTLARQLQLAPDQVAARAQDDLAELGLDSHGLMRVLLDLERQLQLPQALELDDAALATPATLAAGVSARLRGG